MPSKTAKQQRFMGADLARAKAGKKTKTGMSATQLADFAKKPTRGNPNIGQQRAKAMRTQQIGRAIIGKM